MSTTATAGAVGALGAGAAVAGSGGGGSSISLKHTMYSSEQLQVKTVKELGGLLAARGLPVSGKKLDLIKRMMEYQRRVKKASQPS